MQNDVWMAVSCAERALDRSLGFNETRSRVSSDGGRVFSDDGRSGVKTMTRVIQSLATDSR